MPKLPEKDQLDYQWRQLEQRFREFHQFRDQDGPWNRIRRRDYPAPIQPELLPIAEGIDFQSPAIEKATSDWKAICKMEPTVIDARVSGLSQSARDTERDLALFFRRSWDLQNRRREVDDRLLEGVIIHGQKWERKMYRPFMPDEDGDALPPPFSWENCLIDGFFWPGGVVDPEGPVWYRYSVPAVDSDITKNGRKLTLDPQNKVAWLGAHERYDYANSGERKIQVIVRDWPSLDPKDNCCLDDCDHPQRYITTYVCPEGEKLDDAVEVETVASPFRTCSFYAMGGLLQQTERNPHQVYRPLLLPLYELTNQLNYLIKVLYVLARAESKDDSYINVGETNPQTLMAVLPENERGNRQAADLPEAGANQIPLHPGPVERYPKVTSEHLVFLIKLVKEMIDSYLPNRYLTGNADIQASNATGTAFMAQSEAASVVPSVLLAELDGFIERSIRDELHAYRYWSFQVPDDAQPRWMVQVNEKEAMSRGRAKAGEQVYIDAKKCSVDMDWVIITGNKTWAEKQAEWSLAKDQYMMGVLTVEDLIRKAGIYDVEMQQELLFAERIEQGLEPLEDRMAQLILTRRAAIKTGVDFGQLMGGSPPGALPPPSAAPAQLPAGPGGGNSAPINPSTQAASVAHSLQPQVSMPPAQMNPQGGASGVAPGMP